MKRRNLIVLLKKWWSKRFYNRLLLLSAIIFVIVVYSFGVYASVLVTRLNTNSQLQHGREVLAAIVDEYERKHDNFYSIILPIYNSSENYATLSGILDAGREDYINNPILKLRTINMMKELARQDKDIIAVLLHRTVDGQNYIYIDKQYSFSMAPQGFPFFDQLKSKDTYSRTIYGVYAWGPADRRQHTYGIATGSLKTLNNHGNAGRIMMAYDVTGLQNIYHKYDVSNTGRFLIVSLDGDVIFDSAQALYGHRFEHMDIVGRDSSPIMIDGVKSFVQTIDRSNRSYYGLYIETNAALSAKISENQFLIFGICTGVSLLSALIYFLAGLISTHRVRALEHAMENVGLHNLSYRVPLRGKEDEFEHIAARFNLMCDELQSNINKLYINEIKQKNAELNALQAGINPHFLYNTLEAIRGKAQDDGSNDVAELIVMMASLLRSLVRSQMFISIRQEIDFCRMYLDMFVLRYAECFEYITDIDPAILDFGVPKGILQPVLENYFVHGIRDGAFDNRLDITGRLKGDWIVFDIKDNGKGIDAERLAQIQFELKELGTSRRTYGLANVHDRICLVFGEGSGIQIDGGLPGAQTIVHVAVRAITCEDLRKSIGSAV